MSTKLVQLPDGSSIAVSPRPWWLFWVMPGYTITLFPMVYTSKDRYDLIPERMDIWVHENVHLRQQSAMGKWKFYANYVCSRNFRYTAELEAYLVEFKHNISENRTPNLEAVADDLSSMGYLWCVKKAKALADFKAGLGMQA